jgi:hypothetical protein
MESNSKHSGKNKDLIRREMRSNKELIWAIGSPHKIRHSEFSI